MELLNHMKKLKKECEFLLTLFFAILFDFIFSILLIIILSTSISNSAVAIGLSITSLIIFFSLLGFYFYRSKKLSITTSESVGKNDTNIHFPELISMRRLGASVDYKITYAKICTIRKLSMTIIDKIESQNKYNNSFSETESLNDIDLDQDFVKNNYDKNSTDKKIDSLNKLKKLFDDGAITKEEYENLKNRILSQ